MMTKLIKVHNTCVRLSIELDHKIVTFYGNNYSLFRSYTTYLGHSKMNILIDDWGRVPYDLKGSIYTDLKALVLIYMI